MKSDVHFGNKKLKIYFERLKDSKTEGKRLYKWISRAIEDLEKDVFCGIQIPKKLIPNDYIKKYEIDNAWKYDLPQGWRLIYSVTNKEVLILSIILEWMHHKDYEKKFNY